MHKYLHLKLQSALKFDMCWNTETSEHKTLATKVPTHTQVSRNVS